LDALVDSGSDATIVPLRHLYAIGARKIGQGRMRGIVGLGQEVDLYSVFVRFGNREQRTRVVGHPSSQEVILGRDILNQYFVALNGPANTTEVHVEA